MKAKTLILLFVALGCGMIAAVAVSKAVMDNGSGQPKEAMVEIFVAASDLTVHSEISADNVKLQKWPKARLPEGSVFELSKIEAKFASQSIFAGEPILEKKLTDKRGGLTFTIPSGYRTFDISCSKYWIKTGDRVDIMGVFHPGGRQAPPETRYVMRNVKVHSINGNPIRSSEDSEQTAKSQRYQLLVKEEQLEPLTLANKLGTLDLHVCPFEEGFESEDISEFMNWITQEAVAEEEGPDDLFEELNAPKKLPVAQQVSEQKNELLLVTPNGVQRFEWSKNNPVPTEIRSDNGSGAMPANNAQLPYANSYSNYGGYAPTYPVSTGPAPVVTDAPGEPVESDATPPEGVTKPQPQ